ncbi:MAG: hypothetical protein JSS49_24535 [Planctomycetes bacterium]|nr:hypothetical protein [Planctomycetota bacterium]
MKNVIAVADHREKSLAPGLAAESSRGNESFSAVGKKKGTQLILFDMSNGRTVAFWHAASPPKLPWWNVFPRSQSSRGAVAFV